MLHKEADRNKSLSKGYAHSNTKDIKLETNQSQIRSWFFGLTGSMWTKDQVRTKPGPDDASPTASTES
jgi:hypothetical protein